MGRKGLFAAVVVAAGGLAAAGLVGLAGFAHAETGDTAITRVVVNGGKNVNVGITYVKKFTVSVTASDDSGIRRADFYVYGPLQGFVGPSGSISCTASSATASTCTGTFEVDPRIHLWDNGQAGWWKVAAQIEAYDGDFLTDESAGSFRLKHYTRLTTNAYPEPISSGSTLKIVGTFTYANWETRSYTGYSGKDVRLESRPKSGGSYTYVKTVKTTSGGKLYTTVTATSSKCWRWVSMDTDTLMKKTARGDCVSVR